jgi:hypothetical protein
VSFINEGVRLSGNSKRKIDTILILSNNIDNKRKFEDFD